MLRALCVAAVLAAGPAWACPTSIAAATFEAPTDRYPHGVLGDPFEWGRMRLTCGDGSAMVLELPDALVFEDVAPRLHDLDGDGAPEVIVVESHRDRGARLAVWGTAPDGVQRRAETPFIGTRFRWLAPVGAADLDGDGHVEIAFVDRPHLARVLRVWRFRDGTLTEIATAEGFTNHRIGEHDIAGGMRDCGSGWEMVVATADWQRLAAVSLRDGRLATRDIGPHEGRKSFARAMDCR